MQATTVVAENAEGGGRRSPGVAGSVLIGITYPIPRPVKPTLLLAITEPLCAVGVVTTRL